jgi:hypothetical protein
VVSAAHKERAVAEQKFDNDRYASELVARVAL